MLRLQEKTIDDRGYYRRGEYSLRISPIEDGIIDINPDREDSYTYKFRPNPTDIDDAMQFANVVQPDHADGYYVDVNEIGMKTISIRGSTGQKPSQQVFDRLLGTSAINNSGIPLLNPGDGYTIWQELYNFFVTWARLVRDNPHRYALMFINTKDAEIYQVLPMAVRKVRTAARPMSYGFAIDLQVLGEQNPRLTPNSWLDRMDNIRSQIARWENTIGRAVMLASNLMNAVALGGIGVVYGPITSSLTTITSGLQGFTFTAQTIKKNAAYSHERMKEVAEEMIKSGTYEAGFNATTKTITDLNIPAGSVPGVYPPTRDAVYEVLAPETERVVSATIQNLTLSAFGGSPLLGTLALDDPNIESYGDSLRLLMSVYEAADSAPLPSSTPAGNAGSESRDMHRAARAGNAGDLIGRENELASAALAGETTLLEDTVSGAETRHAVRQQKTIETYTLSHLATIVMRDWARASNDRISPQLNAFRKWYLGMRDPSAFSPVYKNVKVGLTDTIYSLATKYLGSWERWTEIALVNGLKYPYISAQGGAYQKKPGELVAIPVENSKIPVEVVEDLIQINETHDLLTTQDIFLGFDVEISQVNGDMVYSVYDVAHLGGIHAFHQEVSLVMEGRGGVTPDRADGPAIRIGSRSKGQQSVDLWKSILKIWFTQDNRVQEVQWVRVEQDGDIVRFASKLKFEHFDTATTVAGELRA